MPDLATELSHLQLADKHVEQARALLAEASERANGRRGPDVSGTEDSLEVMTETLAAFEGHRTLILQTIADIRAGKL
jgi:hypothetical protein